MANMRHMVFHTAYALDPNATSASGIRPVKMLAAFRELGYHVFEVTGTPKQRKAAMDDVRRHLLDGGAIDFAYSESSTRPTLMLPRDLDLRHPTMDFTFMRALHAKHIPIGLFYRDVYWQFPEYRERVGPLLPLYTLPLYRYDLRRYNDYLTRLYLPSMEMARYVPIARQELMEALPPGSDIVVRAHRHRPGTVNLFYVGSLGNHYRLDEGVRAVEQTDGASLTICTAEGEWDNARTRYEPLIDHGHTTVVHTSGAGLEPHYAAADIGVMFFEPIEYREFAVPVKLFEYIGHGIPIIATEGTLAGRFVRDNDLGWVLPYDSQALADLLADLRDHPEKIEEKARSVEALRPAHTWIARAQQVAEDLGPTSSEPR